MIFALDQTSEKGYREIHDEPAHRLGEWWLSKRMNKCLYYVKFAEDLREGDAVRTKYIVYAKANMSPRTLAGSDYPAAGTSVIYEHDANYLTQLAGIPPNPTTHDYAMIAITSGAGVGQRGYIESYSDKQLNIRWYEKGGVLRSPLGSSTDYVIYAPWYVEKGDARTGGGPTLNGIVVSTDDEAKKDKYGWIVNHGRAPVRVSVAVTAGQQLYIGNTTATEGEGEPIAATDVGDAFATAEHATDADTLVECQVYCKPLSIIDNIPDEFISAHPPAASGGIVG